jgi:two-component system, NtrC family, sensor histidine kinase PilS
VVAPSDRVRQVPRGGSPGVVREDGSTMQSMFDERLWLAWLVKVRIIILTFLLGIELVIARLTPTTLPLRLFINTILLWYGISVFYLWLLSFWKEHRIQSALQVITDLALVSLVIYATGGVDSSLNFLYPLVIIVACILLPRVWAYLIAALAFIEYGTILELTYFEVIPSYSTSHPDMRTLQGIILVNLFAFLAVSYLASQLATKLRQFDVKLKDASGRLQNLQALHENIIQSASGGLITTGLDGRITLANPAAQRLLECGGEGLLGRQVHQLFLDRLPEIESPRAHSEVRFVAPNSYRKTFRVIVSALTVPEQGTVGYVYTFDDLTEIRRLEREVRIQDRLAAVGRLAAAIAHEIRNPLTSIAGSVNMLSGIPALSDEHRQLLQIVIRESARLNGIITDFLAYSRAKQYQFKKADLLPLLEDTLTLLQNRLIAQHSGIEIRRRYQTEQAFVLADGDKMKQVFWNFCENALRAMNDRGTLTVSVNQAGGDWQVSFADTGPGISPQIAERIFEPLQSQFEGGTGLGLAIVYQIVQAHEGKVWARSKAGAGSEFVLRLRRMTKEEETEPSAAGDHPPGQAHAELALGAGAGRGGRAHG